MARLFSLLSIVMVLLAFPAEGMAGVFFALAGVFFALSALSLLRKRGDS